MSSDKCFLFFFILVADLQSVNLRLELREDWEQTEIKI